jgi:hypothetical protein
MKKFKFHFTTICFVLLFTGCGKKSDSHAGHEMKEGDSENKALYAEIMNIHDEVMPKTEELYNISKQLKGNLKDATTDAERELLQNQINYFDSVNNMMMDWMHEFRPLPDTTNEKVAQEYYEKHLEKVNAVKQAIITALEAGSN